MLLGATVTAKRLSGIVVRGDTLEFEASYYADGRERSLRDLITQMPGLEVGRDGRITYEGQPVDRILIDGQDVVRSQFEALNSLVLPTDLLNAQVIVSRAADGVERITLNLNSRSQAAWRLGADVASTARAQAVANASALRVHPNRWQYFGRVAHASNGERPGDGSSDLREKDFDIERLRSRVRLTRSPSGAALAFYDEDFNSRSITTAEVNAVRTRGSRETKAYVFATEDERRGATAETAFATLDGRPLGSRNASSVDRLARLFGAVSHADSLGRGFRFVAYANGELARPAVRDVGLTSVASPAGDYRFADRTGRQIGYGVLHATVHLRDSLEIEATTQIHGRRTRSTYELLDDRAIFPLPGDTASGVRERVIAFSRRRYALSQDVRLTYRRGALSLSPLMQVEYAGWAETQADQPSGTYASAGQLRQAHRIYTGAISLRYVRGVLTANANLGAQRLSGHAAGIGGDGAPRNRRWAPLASLNAEWRLRRDLRLYGAATAWTAAFDPEDYWRTVEPLSTRTLVGGFAERRRFSRRMTASATLRQVRSSRGRLLLATVSASREELAVQRRLDRSRGYLFEEIVLAEDLRAFDALGFYQREITRGQHAGLRGSLRLSRFTLPSSGAPAPSVSNARTLLSGDVRSEWSRWLHTRVKLEWSTVTSRSGGGALPTLRVWRPYAEVALRFERWTVRPNASLQIARSGPNLSSLGIELVYQEPASPFSIHASGHDLANYRGSTFRSLVVGPAQVGELSYERLPGYIKAGAKWTFAR